MYNSYHTGLFFMLSIKILYNIHIHNIIIKLEITRFHTWIFIVWPHMYFQLIRVGLCVSTGECHGMTRATPDHHVSQCRQLYLDHKLMALTASGELVVDTFSFPSCCSCHIMNIFELWNRNNREIFFVRQFCVHPVCTIYEKSPMKETDIWNENVFYIS